MHQISCFFFLLLFFCTKIVEIYNSLSLCENFEFEWLNWSIKIWVVRFKEENLSDIKNLPIILNRINSLALQGWVVGRYSGNKKPESRILCNISLFPYLISLASCYPNYNICLRLIWLTLFALVLIRVDVTDSDKKF